jgi:hypothetical protein
MNPNCECGWNDAESSAGLPNHSFRTGARTFLPVSPPFSIPKDVNAAVGIRGVHDLAVRVGRRPVRRPRRPVRGDVVAHLRDVGRGAVIEELILSKENVKGWKPNLLDQFDWTAVSVE